MIGFWALWMMRGVVRKRILRWKKLGVLLGLVGVYVAWKVLCRCKYTLIKKLLPEKYRPKFFFNSDENPQEDEMQQAMKNRAPKDSHYRKRVLSVIKEETESLVDE
ncbi:unnamed protein product [Moneuplotes crassus]|uniref:Uncharacterized protein n=1 Tax=Euplotes crassus TaxID=5936 RepID=A0AAD1XWY9_EUPCR|nr:unnamed protein product [Moneuplotes crassus]